MLDSFLLAPGLCGWSGEEAQSVGWVDLELRMWPRVASAPCETPTSASPGLDYSHELHGQLFLLVVLFLNRFLFVALDGLKLTM